MTIKASRISYEDCDKMAYENDVWSDIPNENVSIGIKPSTIVLIDDRLLVRDCLAQCLRANNNSDIVLVFDNSEQWKQAAGSYGNTSVVVLASGGRKQTEAVIERDLPGLSKPQGKAPVVIVSDVEDFDCIMSAVQAGAKGYVPTSLDLKVTMGVIELVKAGGKFIPASSLAAARQSDFRLKEDRRHMISSALFSQFTRRELAVVDALRQGKSNKIIAYELNMCESTVKVHVRNIMKKLRAKNRTEVAYLYNKVSSLGNGSLETSAANSSLVLQTM